MRRFYVLAACACLALSNTGCFINLWSSDPNERLQQQLNVSEDLRQIKGELARFWMVDQPSHMTPARVHGGIMPSGEYLACGIVAWTSVHASTSRGLKSTLRLGTDSRPQAAIRLDDANSTLDNVEEGFTQTIAFNTWRSCFMKRTMLALAALLTAFVPAQAAGISGQYVEARTCDVWTGPCFANADFNLSGKHAVLAWKIDKGSVGDVNLDGLNVVAVVSAQNTLGLEQSGPARSVLIVDARANSVQKAALIKFAQGQAGKLLDNVAAVQSSPVSVTLCKCDGETCAVVDATVAKVKTRCIDHKEDKACGNESAYYPPLAQGVDARVAGVVEHLFRGKGLAENWSDYGRRGAYVGSFAAR